MQYWINKGCSIQETSPTQQQNIQCYQRQHTSPQGKNYMFCCCVGAVSMHSFGVHTSLGSVWRQVLQLCRVWFQCLPHREYTFSFTYPTRLQHNGHPRRGNRYTPFGCVHSFTLFSHDSCFIHPIPSPFDTWQSYRIIVQPIGFTILATLVL